MTTELQLHDFQAGQSVWITSDRLGYQGQSAVILAVEGNEITVKQGDGRERLYKPEELAFQAQPEASLPPLFTPGQRVRVVSGDRAGKSGVVTTISSSGIVRVRGDEQTAGPPWAIGAHHLEAMAAEEEATPAPPSNEAQNTEEEPLKPGDCVSGPLFECGQVRFVGTDDDGPWADVRWVADSRIKSAKFPQAQLKKLEDGAFEAPSGLPQPFRPARNFKALDWVGTPNGPALITEVKPAIGDWLYAAQVGGEDGSVVYFYQTTGGLKKCDPPPVAAEQRYEPDLFAKILARDGSLVEEGQSPPLKGGPISPAEGSAAPLPPAMPFSDQLSDCFVPPPVEAFPEERQAHHQARDKQFGELLAAEPKCPHCGAPAIVSRGPNCWCCNLPLEGKDDSEGETPPAAAATSQARDLFSLLSAATREAVRVMALLEDERQAKHRAADVQAIASQKALEEVRQLRERLARADRLKAAAAAFRTAIATPVSTDRVNEIMRAQHELLAAALECEEGEG